MLSSLKLHHVQRGCGCRSAALEGRLCVVLSHGQALEAVRPGIFRGLSKVWFLTGQVAVKCEPWNDWYVCSQHDAWEFLENVVLCADSSRVPRTATQAKLSITLTTSN